MKNFTLLAFLFIVLLGAKGVNAQVLPDSQAEQSPCTPLLLCGGGTTTPGSYVGNPDTMTKHLPYPACFSPGTFFNGSSNIVFWQVDIATSGIFVFRLTPTNVCDDYDWIVYKIDPNLGCPRSLDSAKVVRANENDIYHSPGGATGLSVNPPSPGVLCVNAGAGPAFLDSIHAVAGERYLVVINNAGTYGCPPGTPLSGLNINFDSSTAVFLDKYPPALTYITEGCYPENGIIVHTNKQIQCASIAANGSDFTLSGGGVVSGASGIGCPVTGGGYTTDIAVNFNPPLPSGTYTLSIANGSDGNTLLDICDTAVKIPDTLHFYIPPITPLGFVSVDSPACSELHIGMTGKIRCDSIAKDGSDFTVSGPQPVDIAFAYGEGCDSLNYTTRVVLVLKKPIQTDGTYTVTAQNGSDGNTQLDSCAHTQAVGDNISFTINSYDGKIDAFPDTILCHPDYIQLSSINNAIPPDSAVVCGDTGSVCPSPYTFYAAGKPVNSDVNSPFYAYGSNRMQMLYRASELKALGMKPGPIQSAGWNVITKNTGKAFTFFNIKMGCTSSATLPDFQSGMRTVYSNNAYNSVQGWNLFTFTQPFNWDGVSNLVIEVCDSAATMTAADVIENSNTPFDAVIHLYSTTFNKSGCAMLGSSAGVLSPGSSRLRPKTRFNICGAPTGSKDFFTYLWIPGYYIDNSTIPAPRAFIEKSTNYIVKTVDRDGCAHRDSIKVIVSKREPTLTPLDTAFCYGQKVQLTAGGGVTYTWISGNLGALTCTDCYNPLVTPTQSDTYQVKITDAYNCSDTLSNSFTVFPPPAVKVYPHDTIVKYNTTIRLRASGAEYYNWMPNQNLDDIYASSPLLTVLHPQVITVYGTDSNGCIYTDSANIRVDYRMPVLVPSAFSPNKDGKNDLFRPTKLSFQRIIEFRVFNRDGLELYNGDNDFAGWDGTYQGVPQDINVYFYLIRIVYPDGYMETYKGDVTLIR